MMALPKPKIKIDFTHIHNQENDLMVMHNDYMLVCLNFLLKRGIMSRYYALFIVYYVKASN